MENIRKLCPDCQDQELRDEDTVAAYLRDEGHASIEQICRETGVKEATVLRMIKRGSITGGVSYPCDSCGKLIDRGRYCDACANQLQQEFKDFQSAHKPVEKKSEKTSAHERMHISRDR